MSTFTPDNTPVPRTKNTNKRRTMRKNVEFRYMLDFLLGTISKIVTQNTINLRKIGLFLNRHRIYFESLLTVKKPQKYRPQKYT